MEVMKLAATVQFVHQANLDAQVDSVYEQSGNVMASLIALTPLMKLVAIVHQANSDAQMNCASHHFCDVMVFPVA